MRASRNLSTAAFVCLLAAPGWGAAAGKCAVGQTIQECWNLYLPEQAEVNFTPNVDAEVTEKADESAKAEEKDLENLETGLNGGAAPLATTTRNLLPLLAASGLISDSDGDSENGLFALDLNFLIPSLARDNNAQLQAVLNTQPKMFEDLKTEFDTVTGSADRSDALQDDLSASDDYTISFAYNHTSKRFGRAFKEYQRRFSNLFEAAITVANNNRVANSSAVFALADFIEDNGTDDSPIEADTKITTPRMLALVEAAAAQERDLETEVRGVIAGNHLSRFAELVNNQPQLLFSAELHRRDELVGPGEKSFKITYEFGFASVNDFDSEKGNVCNVLDDVVTSIPLERAEACLGAFSSYVSAHEAQLKNADRFSFELSYSEVDEYEFDSIVDGVALARDGTHHLDLSAGYGRTLQTLGADRDSRLDFVLKYEDYSDDVDHQDRMVATLTFTTKVNGFSIPFSLVYANHEKFLPQSDEQLSAHIGFKYELEGKE
jgi:hypothetical protein